MTPRRRGVTPSYHDPGALSWGAWITPQVWRAYAPATGLRPWPAAVSPAVC